MKKQTFLKIAALVGVLAMLVVVLGGCTMIPTGHAPEAAGFFSGIWHGWVAPISLLFSLFGDYHIYEANNTGFFYDLGFYMAIISGFGGLSLARSKKKDK